MNSKTTRNYSERHLAARIEPCPIRKSGKPNFTGKPNKAKDKTQKHKTNKRSISGDQLA